MPTPRRASLRVETLRALAAPRRAVPIALVAASLGSAEWIASASARAVCVDAVLLALFVALGPALWRGLFARPELSWGGHLAGWCLDAVAAAGFVGVAVVLPQGVGLDDTFITEPHALGVLGALFLVGAFGGLGRDIELEATASRERARAEKLAVDAEHAQILALRAQLDPHFLFNTLNAIAVWCRDDAVVAERATLDDQRRGSAEGSGEYARGVPGLVWIGLVVFFGTPLLAWWCVWRSMRPRAPAPGASPSRARLRTGIPVMG